MIKLRILRREDCPGLSGWAQCYHKQGGRGVRVREGDVNHGNDD